MPTRDKKGSPKADAWLLAGSGSRKRRRRRAKTGTASSESDQWLAIPKPAKASPRSSGPNLDGARRAPRGKSRPKPGERIGQKAATRSLLESRLRRAQAEIEAQKSEISELQARIAELEGRNGASAPPVTKDRPRVGLSLNEVTFEQLRELGLSSTQAARVVAAREVQGGYAKWEELDRVPGLSKTTRQKLRDELPLRSR